MVCQIFLITMIDNGIIIVIWRRHIRLFQIQSKNYIAAFVNFSSYKSEAIDHCHSVSAQIY